MRNIIKTSFYFWCWLIRSAANFWQPRPEVIVLMYHSVEDTAWKYGVRVSEFERQLSYLARHLRVVKIEDVVAYVQGRRMLPKRSVAITIDDGYLDTYQAVFPLLKKYNLPATVFLTTDLSPRPELGNLPRPSWEQVAEMARSGLVNFEVHGHEHKNLAALSRDPEALAAEIDHCRELIRKFTGYLPACVAYAAGHKNQAVIDYLKRAGFRAAFAITEGLIRPGDDVYALRRVQVDKTINFALFRMRLTRAVDINRWWVDWIRGHARS